MHELLAFDLDERAIVGMAIAGFYGLVYIANALKKRKEEQEPKRETRRPRPVQQQPSKSGSPQRPVRRQGAIPPRPARPTGAPRPPRTVQPPPQQPHAPPRPTARPAPRPAPQPQPKPQPVARAPEPQPRPHRPVEPMRGHHGPRELHDHIAERHVKTHVSADEAVKRKATKPAQPRSMPAESRTEASITALLERKVRRRRAGNVVDKLNRVLHSRSGFEGAFLLSEILGPPVGFRKDHLEPRI